MDRDDDVGEATLEISLIDSVARSDLKDVAVMSAELGLDSVLDAGLARDIPIIGTLAAMTSMALTIRDRIFAKKVLHFLSNLDNTPVEERQAQIERLAADSAARRRIGETLILLLDRLNDMGKPALLARAFQALLKKEIDREQFQALARVIDNIVPELIATFESKYSSHDLNRILEPSEDMSHFFQCGLLSMKFAMIDTTGRWESYGGDSKRESPGGYLEVNSLGRLFCEVVLATKDSRRT